MLAQCALFADLTTDSRWRHRMVWGSSIAGICGSSAMFLAHRLWDVDNLYYFRGFCMVRTSPSPTYVCSSSALPASPCSFSAHPIFCKTHFHRPTPLLSGARYLALVVFQASVSAMPLPTLAF